MVFTNFLDVSKYDGSKYLEKLLFGVVVPLQDCILLILVLNVGDVELALLLVVDLEILSCIIQSLEEMHNVTKPDVDLHLVHVLEDLSGFYFAVNQ